MTTDATTLRDTTNGKKIGAARTGGMTTGDMATGNATTGDTMTGNATTGPLRPREAQAPLDGPNHQRRIPRGLGVHREAPRNS
jgi:hypothetical protein